METLHRETVDLGGGVGAELETDSASVSAPGPNKVTTWLKMQPRTRQEANRMSIALKKVARRLQDIGEKLPNEPAS